MGAPWRAATAAVAGADHVAVGKSCEDEVRSATTGEVCAVVLADGAGSRARSGVGAAAAADAACAALVAGFDQLISLNTETLRNSLMAPIRDALDRRARQLDVPVRELASTLVFVAAAGERYLAGSIGDSIAARVLPSSGRLLFPPERGEYANETVFTTHPDVQSHLQLATGTVDPDESFLVASDGAAFLLVDYESACLAPGAVQIGRYLVDYDSVAVSEKLEDLLRRKFVTAVGDDCSIGLLARPGR
jgi:hypothetical protein